MMFALPRWVLSLFCVLTGLVGLFGVGYYLYSGSVIMDQADAGTIPAGYTTPLMAFALVAGGILLLCSLILLLVRIRRTTPEVSAVENPKPGCPPLPIPTQSADR